MQKSISLKYKGDKDGVQVMEKKKLWITSRYTLVWCEREMARMYFFCLLVYMLIDE